MIDGVLVNILLFGHVNEGERAREKEIERRSERKDERVRETDCIRIKYKYERLYMQTQKLYGHLLYSTPWRIFSIRSCIYIYIFQEVCHQMI